jgi:hypothetical protein
MFSKTLLCFIILFYAFNALVPNGVRLGSQGVSRLGNRTRFARGARMLLREPDISLDMLLSVMYGIVFGLLHPGLSVK